MGNSYDRESVRSRFSPNVCSYRVSQNASVSVAERCSLLFSLNLLGLSYTKKLNTETRATSTRFDLITFISCNSIELKKYCY